MLHGSAVLMCVCVYTALCVCRCGHCQKLAPVWEQLAREYSSNPSVHISKVDCTQETGTCGQLEVKGYPTLLLLVNGVLVQKYSGSRDLESLTSFITEALVSEVPTHHTHTLEHTLLCAHTHTLHG